MSRVRIGEAARSAGASPRLLRYYEDRGLLHPGRCASGYRDYSEQDVQTIRQIRQLLAAGLGTDTIRTLLPCVSEHAGALHPTCPAQLAALARERERIVQSMQVLASFREAIDAMIEAGTGSPTSGT